MAETVTARGASARVVATRIPEAGTENNLRLNELLSVCQRQDRGRLGLGRCVADQRSVELRFRTSAILDLNLGHWQANQASTPGWPEIA